MFSKRRMNQLQRSRPSPSARVLVAPDRLGQQSVQGSSRAHDRVSARAQYTDKSVTQHVPQSATRPATQEAAPNGRGSHQTPNYPAKATARHVNQSDTLRADHTGHSPPQVLHRATATAQRAAQSAPRHVTQQNLQPCTWPAVPLPAQPSKCYICSHTQQHTTDQKEVFHKHFSSINLRKWTFADAKSVYLCPSCMSHHQPYPNTRIKIAVSDSTLHQFFAPPGAELESNLYKGDTVHIDYVTIPGGTIDTLTNAFRLDYITKPQNKPLDVVLVAGYNDLVKGFSRETIMWYITRFANKVISAGADLHPDNPNTVAIATLMYPPQLAWFPDNGPFPTHNYLNQKEKIDWLNEEIHRLNVRNNVPQYVRFHTYGVRKDTKNVYDQYGQLHQRVVKYHRWQHWRETNPANMLHLKNHRRFKMGTALNNYFILNTIM